MRIVDECSICIMCDISYIILKTYTLTNINISVIILLKNNYININSMPVINVLMLIVFILIDLTPSTLPNSIYLSLTSSTSLSFHLPLSHSIYLSHIPFTSFSFHLPLPHSIYLSLTLSTSP